jgi:hypothetical protein
MATTTNYSWSTPDDTALVKDGAAAIRSLGTAIDSTVFTNAGNAVAKSVVDAKGDLIVGTADNTVARLASSGVNGEVLQVDTSTATGLKYGAIAAGANWSLLNAGGTALTGANTITVSGISAKDKIFIYVTGASTTVTTQPYLKFRFNTDSGSNYNNNGFYQYASATYFINYEVLSDDDIIFGGVGNSAANTVNGTCLISGCNSSGLKVYQSTGLGSGTGRMMFQLNGYYNSASTISSISVITEDGNFDAGTVYVYTSA